MDFEADLLLYFAGVPIVTAVKEDVNFELVGWLLTANHLLVKLRIVDVVHPKVCVVVDWLLLDSLHSFFARERFTIVVELLTAFEVLLATVAIAISTLLAIVRAFPVVECVVVAVIVVSLLSFLPIILLCRPLFFIFL